MAGGKIPRNCETCSKEFMVFRHDVKRGRGRFCSLRCCSRSRTIQGTQTVACKACGQPFAAYRSAIERGRGMYCSTTCRWPDGQLSVRFWAKVDKTPGLGPQGECWEWRGALNSKGYGSINCEGRLCIASRVSLEMHSGPIPEGMNALHRCDNPPCVRPEHLFCGTQRDNMLDMVSKGRGHLGGTALLTEIQVREIRQRYAQGGITYAALGEMFGVGYSAINHIVHRRTWTQI